MSTSDQIGELYWTVIGKYLMYKHICWSAESAIFQVKDENHADRFLSVILEQRKNLSNSKLSKEKYELINISNLREYINVSRQIQKDIEEKGFYPDNKFGQKRKLCEKPLYASGIYGW